MRKRLLHAFAVTVLASYCMMLNCCSHSARVAVVQAAKDVLDCTTDNDLVSAGGLAQLVLDASGGDWKHIRERLEPLGERLALCIGAEILQLRMSALRVLVLEEQSPLEPLKARWGVRVVRTRSGEY